MECVWRPFSNLLAIQSCVAASIFLRCGRLWRPVRVRVGIFPLNSGTHTRWGGDPRKHTWLKSSDAYYSAIITWSAKMKQMLSKMVSSIHFSLNQIYFFTTLKYNWVDRSPWQKDHITHISQWKSHMTHTSHNSSFNIRLSKRHEQSMLYCHL